MPQIGYTEGCLPLDDNLADETIAHGGGGLPSSRTAGNLQQTLNFFMTFA
jgi:hypothetical protein